LVLGLYHELWAGIFLQRWVQVLLPMPADYSISNCRNPSSSSSRYLLGSSLLRPGLFKRFSLSSLCISANSVVDFVRMVNIMLSIPDFLYLLLRFSMPFQGSFDPILYVWGQMLWICHGIADSTSSFLSPSVLVPAVIPLSSHTVTRERFTAFRQCIPFWYLLLIRLVLSCCSHLYSIQTRTLRWVKFYPCTVAPCTLRHRFGVSLAWPSLLLWVRPTSHNALLRFSHQVIPMLPVSFHLRLLTQNLVGCGSNSRRTLWDLPRLHKRAFETSRL